MIREHFYFIPCVSLTPAVCQEHLRAFWSRVGAGKRRWLCFGPTGILTGFPVCASSSSLAEQPRMLCPAGPRGCTHWLPLRRSWPLCEGVWAVPCPDGSLTGGEAGCCGPSISPADSHRLRPRHPVLTLPALVFGTVPRVTCPEEQLCDLGQGADGASIMPLSSFPIFSSCLLSSITSHCWDLHVLLEKEWVPVIGFSPPDLALGSLYLQIQATFKKPMNVHFVAGV